MECVRVRRVIIGEGKDKSEAFGDAEADLGDGILFVDNPLLSGVVAIFYQFTVVLIFGMYCTRYFRIYSAQKLIDFLGLIQICSVKKN